MNIMLNNYCNLNCKYCFAPKSNENISDEDMDKYIEFLKISNYRELRLLGGEPSLHPHFTDYVLRAINDDFFDCCVIFSNGLKLTPEITNKFKSSKIGYLINLNNPKSIGDKKYNLTVENIKHIRSLKNNLGYNMNISLGINIDDPEFEYEYIIDVAKDLQIIDIRFSIVCPSNIKENTTLNYYEQFMPQLVKFLQACKEKNIIANFDCPNIPMCLFNEYKLMDYLPKRFLENNQTLGYTNDCNPVLDINPNLYVARCFPFSENKISLLDFKNRDELINYMQDLESEKFVKPRFTNCIDCKYFLDKVCQGGCLAFQ